MQRISTSTKAVDLFGAGKHGFRNGNLALGQAPTDFDADWCNSIQEELAAIVEAVGMVPTLAVRDQALKAIFTLMQRMTSAVAVAGGTANAITADFTPDITVLTPGMIVRVRAAAANSSTTPTFSPDAIAAKTIVKGANAALVNGDIAGAGHWIELQYDQTLDKWVLNNPATGVVAVSGFQPLDATLTALAALATSTDQMIYTTGSDSFSATTLTAFARSLLDDANAAAALATLGIISATTASQGLVQLATSAEAQAFSSSTKALTPSTLAGALQGSNQSFGTNGYQKLPGGFILQWGRALECANSTDYRTFPIAFPTACYGVFLQNDVATPGGFTQNIGTVVSVIDATKFVFNMSGTFDAPGSAGTAFYFAIGR